MNEIIMKVSDLTGISVTDILSRRRTGDVCEARKIFIYMSWKHLGVSQKNIAEFTNRTQQNISDQMLDFDQQLRIYKGLKDKTNSITEQIFVKNQN